jgi:hypothetical protein
MITADDDCTHRSAHSTAPAVDWAKVKYKLRTCRNSVAAYMRKMKTVTGGQRVSKPAWFEHARYLQPYITTKQGIETAVVS